MNPGPVILAVELAIGETRDAKTRTLEYREGGHVPDAAAVRDAHRLPNKASPPTSRSCSTNPSRLFRRGGEVKRGSERRRAIAPTANETGNRDVVPVMTTRTVRAS